MPNNSRELVTRALQFQRPSRVPRDLWTLPWAETRHPEKLAELRARFPQDIVDAPCVYEPSPRIRGDQYSQGSYTDEWGCRFENIQSGAIGEVREPLLPEVAEWRLVRPPHEILPSDVSSARSKVNRFCGGTHCFVIANACPRPWERYQFLRSSVHAMMDIALWDESSMGLLSLIHEFYLRELEFWVSTDVDAVKFMDDWGSQRQLLIAPPRWREIFKPLYRDYCDLAHAHGKFVFMHSDGYILDIYRDLIEIGVDAVNSQLFCMDLSRLAAIAKGNITFWGEIDRQHILPSGDPDVGRKAVREIADHLYDPAGGIIAQLEFGLGANPETVWAVYEEWERVGGA